MRTAWEGCRKSLPSLTFPSNVKQAEIQKRSSNSADDPSLKPEWTWVP